MKHARTRLPAVVALPFLLALVLDLVFYAALRDRLPTRLATHFTGTGTADGHTGQTAFVLAVSAALVLLGALWAAATLRPGRPAGGARTLAGSAWGTAAFLGFLTAATLRANLRTLARLPLWQLAEAAGVAAVAAGIGLLLVRYVPKPDPEPSTGLPRARVELADGEVAGWARRVDSWWVLAGAATLLAAGVVVWAVLGRVFAVPALAIGFLTLLFARPYVTVDRRGVAVTTGWLPWPRIRVPLSRIGGASHRNVDALMDFGGWGHRVRPGATGIILRSGDALVVRRTGGREFVVTVDGAAEAAALLNTLAERDRGQASR
ncbi:DUF1648 domain-containing protein [Streptomyces beijiangensis]|uniref:DUF1648 domain-containing protein n=1 Tax=Streptomyces beijiangensis TaxID=163361 RepID=A0A939FB94_9ACTN|nr:DUF1648 domain-containing protein [Streptomyces beijiangensis]MBO0515099.1 DUF1648 domain-containing protein [Streptomyces beijiangensis]